MFINILFTGKLFIHLWQQIGTKHLENRIPYIVLPHYGGNKNPNLGGGEGRRRLLLLLLMMMLEEEGGGSVGGGGCWWWRRRKRSLCV